IRDVYVHSGYYSSGDQSAGGYNGTLFKNVTNGLVETSTIYGNKFGVSVISSDSFAIRDNIIQNNSRGAIEMDTSSNIELGQNHVEGNLDGNIAVRDSGNLSVDANFVLCQGSNREANCQTRSTGIELSESSSLEVSGNSITPSITLGLSLDYVTQATVSYNDIFSNTQTGTAMVATNSGNISIF